MNPAVSVIIPVYNVQKYIGECARSLFGQTLEDVEYIFVNDCTPDGSMEVLRKVLESFPERLPGIKIVVKQKNEGLPAARRSGLEHATGRYVIHCDSDDWMEPHMLERMYREASAYDADAVVCAYFQDMAPISTHYVNEGKNCRDAILSDMIAVGEMQSVWRYMFRREVYSDDLVFPRHNQGEDLALLVQLAWHCRSIYCVKEPLYHWRYNTNSLTWAAGMEAASKRFRGAVANTALVDTFLRKVGADSQFSDELAAQKLFSKFYLRPLLKQGLGLKEWRGAFPDIKGKVLSNKHIIFEHKLEYLLFTYLPASYVRFLAKIRGKLRKWKLF